MGFFDSLFENPSKKSNKSQDWDRSVFDTDRFRNRKSGNWVDWDDVSTGDVETDGFEHPNFDDDGEW
ncbi:MAG: hypothetical protein PUC53_08550 [Bacteroidales bacterium]|nr:hypothetical protein [Bacteroidales bacterium]